MSASESAGRSPSVRARSSAEPQALARLDRAQLRRRPPAARARARPSAIRSSSVRSAAALGARHAAPRAPRARASWNTSERGLVSSVSSRSSTGAACSSPLVAAPVGDRAVGDLEQRLEPRAPRRRCALDEHASSRVAIQAPRSRRRPMSAKRQPSVRVMLSIARPSGRRAARSCGSARRAPRRGSSDAAERRARSPAAARRARARCRARSGRAARRRAGARPRASRGSSAASRCSKSAASERAARRCATPSSSAPRARRARRAARAAPASVSGLLARRGAPRSRARAAPTPSARST